MISKSGTTVGTSAIEPESYFLAYTGCGPSVFGLRHTETNVPRVGPHGFRLRARGQGGMVFPPDGFCYIFQWTSLEKG